MRSAEGQRRTAAVWIIASALLLGLGLALALFLHEAARAREAGALNRELRAADRELSGGFYDRAGRLVASAARFAASQEDWLEVAKRAYEIARARGSYGLLRDVALKGTRQLPGAVELWALLVFADDRSGRYAEAVEIARRHLSGSQWSGLSTEAVLRAYPAIEPGSAVLDARGRAYVDAITSRNPDLFRQLATETGNSDFLVDAVLLDAYRGDLAGAYRLLLSLRSAADPELGMLLSYDAGKLDTASGYYESIPPDRRSESLELLAIDILMAQGRYEEAQMRYESFVERHPDYSWVPYVNLGWLDRKRAGSRGLEFLREGGRLFPTQKEVALDLADAYRLAREPAKAVAALSGYLKAKPDDLDANLMMLRVSGATANPEAYRSRLWQLFYQSERGDPADTARVARCLGWYLFGINDSEGIKLILRLTKADEGAGWYHFYQGALASVAQNFTLAIEDFEKAAAVKELWQISYDIGLLQARLGRYTQASDSLEKADLLLEESAAVVQSPERARIHVELAEVLYRAGNVEGAKRELLYALEMDPGSLAGGLLLRKLESAAEK